jgi:hypothetical protein
MPWAWPCRRLVVDRQEPKHMFPRLIQRHVLFRNQQSVCRANFVFLARYVMDAVSCPDETRPSPGPPTAQSFEAASSSKSAPVPFFDPVALQPCRPGPHPQTWRDRGSPTLLQRPAQIY